MNTNRLYLDCSDIGSDITGQLDNLFAELLFDSDLPIGDPLADESLQGRDVDDLSVRMIPEHGQHRDLSNDGLSRTWTRTKERHA